MFISLVLIMLHSADGHEVAINPSQITSMWSERGGAKTNNLFTDKVRCVIGLADGKFVTSAENCDAVRKMLEDKK